MLLKMLDHGGLTGEGRTAARRALECQTQIAAKVGLSQMQVSRLLKQSLVRLRTGLPS
jgi:hypothetical protein